MELKEKEYKESNKLFEDSTLNAKEKFQQIRQNLEEKEKTLTTTLH